MILRNHLCHLIGGKLRTLCSMFFGARTNRAFLGFRILLAPSPIGNQVCNVINEAGRFIAKYRALLILRCTDPLPNPPLPFRDYSFSVFSQPNRNFGGM